MVDDIKSAIAEIDDLKSQIMCCVKGQFANGIHAVDTNEAKEAIDMIKDLAEAKKDCYKAEYYKTVIEAMEEGGEPTYGYNGRRYNSGRYAPKGEGHMGYTRPYEPYMDDAPYLKAYMTDPEDFKNHMIGYTGPDTHGNIGGSPMRREMTSERYGMDIPKYGKAWNEYESARRHYTETHSQADKDKMTMHANEHVNDTVSSMKEMYMNADPNLRMQMKDSLTRLINDMK